MGSSRDQKKKQKQQSEESKKKRRSRFFDSTEKKLRNVLRSNGLPAAEKWATERGRSDLLRLILEERKAEAHGQQDPVNLGRSSVRLKALKARMRAKEKTEREARKTAKLAAKTNPQSPPPAQS